jgi:hypothetical protein
MPKPKPLKGASPSATEPPAKPGSDKSKPAGQPFDVAAIRAEIRRFFQSKDKEGRTLGRIQCGVYAFYDYDGEPIYIGQTLEGLGARIGRHLTNQRTDAVAMNVLDPFEVAEIRVWPLDIAHLPIVEQKAELDRAEYTLYGRVIAESSLKAVLNEKPPRATPLIKLPAYYSHRIIPADIFPHRKHPDIRIARRASTIAALARVISERKVSKGLRNTLLTQARRLEKLASERLAELANSKDEGEDLVHDGD